VAVVLAPGDRAGCVSAPQAPPHDESLASLSQAAKKPMQLVYAGDFMNVRQERRLSFAERDHPD
jgi:hypothetical protein